MIWAFKGNKCTYNIPRISKVGVRSHEKAHSNDLHGHFPGVDNEEDEVNNIDVVRDKIDFLVQGEEKTVDEDDE